MPDPSIADFMTRLGGALIPAKAAGLNASIQLNLTGAQAADWVVAIQDGACRVSQGTDRAARLTVRADSGDFIKIFSGQMDGMSAFMQGKLKVSGDTGLAMKLMTLFEMN